MNQDNETIKTSQPAEEGLHYTYNREMFYHFDREKGFTSDLDYQNPNNQIIIKQSWDVAAERLEEIRKKVMAGQLSPIAYHMERILMEVPMLAAYMEIAKWRVKRHMKPSVFKKLKPELLQKYADIFEITVDDLVHPERLKDNSNI